MLRMIKSARDFAGLSSHQHGFSIDVDQSDLISILRAQLEYEILSCVNCCKLNELYLGAMIILVTL